MRPHATARTLAKTEAFAQSRRYRKKVEMLFAHLKRILRLDRLRLRGPSGAQFEFMLAGHRAKPEASRQACGSSPASDLRRVPCPSRALPEQSVQCVA
jgi:hypothetical protein